MRRSKILEIFQNQQEFHDQNVTVCGWVRTVRNSKAIAFLELNDGSCFSNLQVVLDRDKLENYDEVVSLNVGASVCVSGGVSVTPDAKQPLELSACKVQVIGKSFPEYPLQKKRHSLEYLRTIAHLRPRTNTFSAVFRVRSAAAFAIHQFFQERGFLYVNTPIITASDCEGAGEMFTVTTLDPLKSSDLTQDGYSDDFFQKHTSLTVSGQLEAECLAMAFSDVYTFGPTFRAEKSFTQRHAAEFWMVEPEIAFADLDDDRKLAEELLKFVINSVLERCPQDMEFFHRFVNREVRGRLEKLLTSEFACITYTDAINILQKHNDDFEFKVEWGSDLQTEHERFLTEKTFQKPLFVVDFPKDIKSFYMRQNDDGRTVAAMDLLVPGVGELMGGSQREERLDFLVKRMKELNLSEEDYWWYLDLRRFGSVPHAGFGLGFERLIMYLTGVENIRDVLPFPRTPKSAEF